MRKKDLDCTIIDDEVNGDSIVNFYEGVERPLGDGENLIGEWSFG